MGTEAQKLITVSLEKIAHCRRRRREMSLHKNLLVTTVIHKARIAIMEETYYMMSYANGSNETQPPYYSRPPTPMYGSPGTPMPSPHYQPPAVPSTAVTDLASREPEAMEWEAGDQVPSVAAATDTDSLPCDSGDEEEDDDKENLTPVDYSPCGAEPTTTTLHKLACRTSSNVGPVRAHKRHRLVGDDEESSQPKKIKWDTTSEMEVHRDDQDDTSHTLRLVSVFSASLSGPCPRLVRSMSTPDLCSQQAKDMMELMGSSRPLAIAV